eukprot:TRINITY_DN10207_c0_g2_i1.p1 TRINITY_DN10207_c0_g2~~TRINITY_DN10207_c0_g2_i1.p1  ORF type:complete len:170 (+),score=17.46 TRINITY_DN10207_c0_g2_i1:188-697(+)
MVSFSCCSRVWCWHVLADDLSLATCGIQDGDHVAASKIAVQTGMYTFKTTFSIESGIDIGAGNYDPGFAEYELVIAEDGTHFVLGIKQSSENPVEFKGRINKSEKGVEFVFDKANYDGYDWRPIEQYLSIRLDEDAAPLLTDKYDPLENSDRESSCKKVVEERMVFQSR